MNRNMVIGVFLYALVAASLLATCASAQVLSYTVGVDVNCPDGCYVSVREGLQRLPDVEWIDERPNVEAATRDLRMKSGRLIDPQWLAQHIHEFQVGARLRGLEGKVKGSIEKHGAEIVLRLPEADHRLHLAPLTRKVQWDVVGNRVEPPTPDESTAYKRLLSQWDGKPHPVLVIGPLLKRADGSFALEVREFDLQPVPTSRLNGYSLTLGVNVNSPYGLGEPWLILREGLLRSASVIWVAERPDIETATVQIRWRDGSLPDLEAISKALVDTGAGASLRGVDAAIDGWLEGAEIAPVLRIAGENQPLTLAPLSRLIQWDARKKAERAPTDEESSAYVRMLSQWKQRPVRVQITGALTKQNGATPLTLQVRSFAINP